MVVAVVPAIANGGGGGAATSGTRQRDWSASRSVCRQVGYSLMKLVL